MDAPGDVLAHIRRRLSLKNFNEIRLDYSRYMTMRFTKPSYIFVLDLGLDVLNGVAGLYLEGDGSCL